MNVCFATKQPGDRISDSHGVHFPSYLVLDFLMILLFWVVFPYNEFISGFFFRKGIIGSIEKVFSRDSYVFEMVQWF